jgi:uncharacterized protein (TIGR03083 family)
VTTRDELLDGVRSQRATLDEAVVGVPEDVFTTVTDASGPWSAKDQLAHITAWHRVALGRLTGASPDEITKRAVNGEYTGDTIDDINQSFHERDAALSPADVRAAFEDVYQELVVAIEGLTDAQLSEPWLPGHPERGSYAQMLESNTTQHYEEHLPTLQALVG